MNKNRLLGVLLFSVAGLIVWVGFLFFIGDFSFSFDSLTMGGGLLAVISAFGFSFFFYPGIEKNAARSSAYYVGFTYGVIITLLSYLFGAVFFGILFSWGETVSSILETISMMIFFCLIFLSPGFLLGGLTGILTCYMIKRSEPKTE